MELVTILTMFVIMMMSYLATNKQIIIRLIFQTPPTNQSASVSLPVAGFPWDPPKSAVRWRQFLSRRRCCLTCVLTSSLPSVSPTNTGRSTESAIMSRTQPGGSQGRLTSGSWSQHIKTVRESVSVGAMCGLFLYGNDLIKAGGWPGLALMLMAISKGQI